MSQKITFHVERHLVDGFTLSAYVGDNYAGSHRFIGYTLAQARKIARETIRERGGLGLYARRAA
jgi:hypothetical protein